MSGKWNQFVLVIVNQKHENCIKLFITFTLQNNCYLDILCVCVLSAGCHKLKQLLSFAIGGLLGDVFLHLLPEAWELSGSSGGSPFHQCLHHLCIQFDLFFYNC